MNWKQKIAHDKLSFEMDMISKETEKQVLEILEENEDIVRFKHFRVRIKIKGVVYKK